ncbi:secondary thiamine-phosphate synthase enzyme YjbQ [Methylophilus flavus]|jgi:secondary thiamine-phosphate synthase enzyme|uniref:Secondary thiamine-phosphate synthase enzyme YjbQ n=1 Tax=Methylophilus flavus TaxID=640084 RepID=A0ABW3PIM3_9PROT
MRQSHETLSINAQGRRLYDITPQVAQWIEHSSVQSGLLTLYIQHTSASLLINENYDRDVLVDLEAFFNRLAPDGDELFIHTVEGPDDMPAHVRTALTQTSLSIPVINGKVALGQWQGIFLFEHRHQPARRQVLMHVIGE